MPNMKSNIFKSETSSFNHYVNGYQFEYNVPHCLVRKSKRYETFEEYTRFIRLAQKVFQVRASSYRVLDSSHLSGCTFESTFVCIVRVSTVRLFKYEHQRPPIIVLLHYYLKDENIKRILKHMTRPVDQDHLPDLLVKIKF